MESFEDKGADSLFLSDFFFLLVPFVGYHEPS